MAVERSSISPLKRPLAQTYRVDPDLRPAIVATADLLHASVASRVAEDAVVEALLDLGYLPSGTQRGLMPTVEAITTKEKAEAAQAALCDLFDALSGRIQGSTAPNQFYGRAVSLAALENAIEQYPRQPPFFWPARKGHDQANLETPQKLFIHPRTRVALDAWTTELAKRSTKASVAGSIHHALSLKLENLGIDPSDFLVDSKKVLKRPI